PEFPNGNRYYTKEAHINELPEEALEILVSRWGEMKMSGEIEIIGLGGAMARVSPDATAFANRHHNWWLNFALHWDEAQLDASNRRRAMGDLENRVVIITGGARGIGLGIAEAVADQGACVVLADILEEEAKESAKKLGNGHLGIKHDVRKADSAKNLVEKTLEKFG